MNIETLRCLQKRVREATGPDPELDLAIADAFHQQTIWCGGVYIAKLYTTDPDGLGACKALQNEVLPGWKRRIREGEQFLVELRDPRAGWEQAQYDTHALETHAHLLAIIAARIAVIEEMEKADAN